MYGIALAVALASPATGLRPHHDVAFCGDVMTDGLMTSSAHLMRGCLQDMGWRDVRVVYMASEDLHVFLREHPELAAQQPVPNIPLVGTT